MERDRAFAFVRVEHDLLNEGAQEVARLRHGGRPQDRPNSSRVRHKPLDDRLRLLGVEARAAGTVEVGVDG